ncbi:hypothetical protein [Georgenia sp.]
MDPRPWPSVEEEDAWLIDAFQESIARADRSPDELRQRARELRQQAADSDFKGMQDASLAMAERYEAAAAARVSTR